MGERQLWEAEGYLICSGGCCAARPTLLRCAALRRAVQVNEMVSAAIPLGHMGRRWDIAMACLFLARWGGVGWVDGTAGCGVVALGLPVEAGCHWGAWDTLA